MPYMDRVKGSAKDGDTFAGWVAVIARVITTVKYRMRQFAFVHHMPNF
jgi:hypothetical protein